VGEMGAVGKWAGGGLSFGVEAATWRARNEHICSTLLRVRVCPLRESLCKLFLLCNPESRQREPSNCWPNFLSLPGAQVLRRGTWQKKKEKREKNAKGPLSYTPTPNFWKGKN